LIKDAAMQLSHLSRKHAMTMAATLLVAASACSDSTNAPANVVTARVPAGFDRVTGSISFVVGNRATNQALGKHNIYFADDAICDPQSSEYGPDFWDKNCRTVKKPITITATLYEDNKGEPYVDFQPALRFNPKSGVYLYMYASRLQNATFPVIKYCNDLGVCVDESLNDPSLGTFRYNSKIIFRRIKHFSGYMISSGRSLEGDEVSISMARRSGYMVASGLSDVTDTPVDEIKPETRKRWDQ